MRIINKLTIKTNLRFRWVREFLNEQNQGLDVLIDYLSFRLSMMRHEQRIALARSQSSDGINQGSNVIRFKTKYRNPESFRILNGKFGHFCELLVRIKDKTKTYRLSKLKLFKNSFFILIITHLVTS